MLARLQMMRHFAVKRCLEQADVARAGMCRQFFQCAVANAAFGCRDRTDESGIIVGIGNQAQVGGKILDFGVIEE